MKELLPVIIQEIEKSYFAKIDRKVAFKVIQQLQSFAEMDKRSVLLKLSKRPMATTAEWNLFAVAWRAIERSMDYPFQPGHQFKLNGRNRTIIEIKRKERMAVLGVPPTFRKFCTLSKIRHKKSQIPVR